MRGKNLFLFSIFLFGFVVVKPVLKKVSSEDCFQEKRQESRHKRNFSESDFNKRKIDITSLSIILFNNLFALYTFEFFFIGNFVLKNNLSRDINSFEYMSKIVSEYIKYNKDRLDLNKIPPGFFKLALMAELASDDKDIKSYVSYKIIFNKLVISGSCDKLSFVDLNLDDKFLAREIAPIVTRLRIFRPNLYWAESGKVLGLSW